ncbi:MAG TPA: AAA family ATPase, partial [Saprospiraceae bacterium]|nr:AAA family ATPase [Saprospiraceae bacterium]
MAKVKKIFLCANCGAESAKWIGKCPACGEWNTYREEVLVKETTQEEKRRSWVGKSSDGRSSPRPVLLEAIVAGNTQRILTPDQELNRVLGGGIVPGSLVLIGGQPGIGKSTLMLQLALSVRVKVLYVSGEESEEQIKMRADRIADKAADCYILTETN